MAGRCLHKSNQEAALWQANATGMSYDNSSDVSPAQPADLFVVRILEGTHM